MESLRDKVVLITGSSSGIGASSALEFAKAGSKIMLTGRNEKNLRRVQEECEKAGASQVSFVTCEMSNDGDIKKLVDSIITKFSTIDVLVNNAGFGIWKNLVDMDMDEYDLIFRVNVRGPVVLTRLCIPHLKQTKGSVINVSSAYGTFPSTNMGAYCMTKAALDMFTKVMTVELGAAGIRVNSVNPGTVITEMVEKVRGDGLEEYQRERSKCYPIGRLGQPQEVAKVITFLASDAASFMTGSLCPVDGGIGVTASLSYTDMANQRSQPN